MQAVPGLHDTVPAADAPGSVQRLAKDLPERRSGTMTIAAIPALAFGEQRPLVRCSAMECPGCRQVLELTPRSRYGRMRFRRTRGGEGSQHVPRQRGRSQQ
jgi:hypothetical protein